MAQLKHRRRRLGAIFRRQFDPVVPEETPPRRSPDPAARGATVGRGRVAETDARSRLELGIERFNSSPEHHTVAGLTRSLGVPRVSVGAAAGSPAEIRITVAWELSWYQWGVDLYDETRPVRAISKGSEVGELDSGAQHWNARLAEDTRLRLGPDRGRAR